MAQKRLFQATGLENNAGEEKRSCRSLQSAVLEVVGTNAMQKLWVLEPSLRRMVREEVERVIANHLPSTTLLGSRPQAKQLENPKPTSLRLQFQNKLAFPLYTGCKIEGEQGSSLQVSLQDASTGQVVIVEDESSLKLDIVVLEGDFPNNEEQDWSLEEFENHVVKERDGKPPLLTGDVSIPLKEGMATIGELIFTDNSSWIRSRKFRLGVRLSTGCLNGIRVREAKTEAFFVRDHRGQSYKKHYPPNLSDDVWRLKKIGKDGAYHKRLCEYDVNTVKDFLVLYDTAPSRLREIFGTTMSNKTWDSIVDHAKTCILNETQYVYYPNNIRTIGVVLDTIYQPLGIVRNGGSYVPASSLTDTEQVSMNRLVEEAHRNVSNLQKLPACGKYQEAYSDQSHPCKVVLQECYQEADEVLRSGCPLQFYDGPFQTEAHAQPPSQACRNEQSLYESNGATFIPGYVPSTSQIYRPGFTIGVGVEQSSFSSAISPETLESLFAYGNHGEKDFESMGEDLAMYQSQSRCDYNKGPMFDLGENEELFMLTSVNTGSFSNATATKYTFPRLSNAQIHDTIGDSLFPRAYMGWRKLKLIMKCSNFMRRVIASRRQVD